MLSKLQKAPNPEKNIQILTIRGNLENSLYHKAYRAPQTRFLFFRLTAEMCRSFHISWFLGIRDRTRLNQLTFWSRTNHMESEPVGSDWVQTWSHIRYGSNFDVSLSTFLCTFFTLMHVRCWQTYLKAGFDVLKYPSHYHPNDPTPQYWHTYSLFLLCPHSLRLIACNCKLSCKWLCKQRQLTSLTPVFTPYEGQTGTTSTVCFWSKWSSVFYMKDRKDLDSTNV